MKLNSKRSETKFGTLIDSKLEPFIQLKRSDLRPCSDHVVTKKCFEAVLRLLGFIPVATRFHSGNRPV